MEFKMILSIPVKNVTWILTGIALFINLGELAYLLC